MRARRSACTRAPEALGKACHAKKAPVGGRALASAGSGETVSPAPPPLEVVAPGLPGFAPPPLSHGIRPASRAARELAKRRAGDDPKSSSTSMYLRPLVQAASSATGHSLPPGDLLLPALSRHTSPWRSESGPQALVLSNPRPGVAPLCRLPGCSRPCGCCWRVQVRGRGPGRAAGLQGSARCARAGPAGAATGGTRGTVERPQPLDAGRGINHAPTPPTGLRPAAQASPLGRRAAASSTPAAAAPRYACDGVAGAAIVVLWGGQPSWCSGEARDSCSPRSPLPPPPALRRTQGYWKNRPDCWPPGLTGLQVGSHWYTVPQLQAILGRGGGVSSS